MTRQQVVLRHPSSVHRRQPLLAPNKSTSSSSGTSSPGGRRLRLGELAGGTAAECAAVGCCCPFALLNLLVLAVYKVPAGLCRKALRRRRLRRRKGLPPKRDVEIRSCASMEVGDLSPAAVKSLQWDKDVLQLEMEMWDRFNGTGFWRSPSQRHEK